MLICKDCGQTFEEEEVVVKKEHMGEFWGAEAYEERCYCPHCGSSEFDEAEQCKICGEWFMQERWEEECPDCMNDLSEELHKLKNKYNMTYDDFKSFVADVFEW